MIAHQPRVLSFGAGVQSHALLALLGQGRYPGNPPDELWFCDPKGERPGTYEFLERVTKPYCAKLGIPFLTLEKAQGKVRGPDLLESYRAHNAYPFVRDRHCTVDWKIKVMLAECKRRGWNKAGGVEKHIGISMDELHRAHSGLEKDWEVKRYPLLEARMYRDACAALCQDEFGEVPIKSGCWFCKYQRRQQWREVWEQRADGRWARAVQWESEVLAAHDNATVVLVGLLGGVVWFADVERGAQTILALADRSPAVLRFLLWVAERETREEHRR